MRETRHTHAGGDMNVLLLTTNIRVEEKLIIAALDAYGCDYSVIDSRKRVFDREGEEVIDGMILFNRCIGQIQSISTTRYYESFGIPSVNSSETISVCGDKQAATLRFQAAGLAVPRTVFALGRESALRAVAELGPPVVIKPIVGSWGRMVVRANDLDSAEAIIELRENMPGPQHRLHYIQKLVETGNRDIRVITIDGDILAAYIRRSDHWITNAARGATGEPITRTPALETICRKASEAVGGGILSFDLFETANDGYLVNEANHTTEFALATQITGVNIAAAFVAFLQRKSVAWCQ